MHVPFGDDACERSRHPQVPFHVANGVERLPGRFDTLLSGEDLVRARIRRLFRDHDVVSGHHARRRRRGLEPGERALVGVSLGTRHRKLGLCRLQFRLRLRPLRHEFRRFERGQQLSRADSGAAVHVDGFHESGDPREHGHRLKRRQLARQRQRHVKRLLDDANHVDRGRASRRRDGRGARCAVATSARRGDRRRQHDAEDAPHTPMSRFAVVIVSPVAFGKRSPGRPDRATVTWGSPTAESASTPKAAQSTWPVSPPPGPRSRHGQAAPSPRRLPRCASAIGIMPAIMAALVIRTGRMRRAPRRWRSAAEIPPCRRDCSANVTSRIAFATATPIAMMAPMNDWTFSVVPVSQRTTTTPASTAGTVETTTKASRSDWKFAASRRKITTTATMRPAVMLVNVSAIAAICPRIVTVCAARRLTRTSNRRVHLSEGAAEILSGDIRRQRDHPLSVDRGRIRRRSSRSRCAPGRRAAACATAAGGHRHDAQILERRHPRLRHLHLHLEGDAGPGIRPVVRRDKPAGRRRGGERPSDLIDRDAELSRHLTVDVDLNGRIVERLAELQVAQRSDLREFVPNLRRERPTRGEVRAHHGDFDRRRRAEVHDPADDVAGLEGELRVGKLAMKGVAEFLLKRPRASPARRA